MIAEERVPVKTKCHYERGWRLRGELLGLELYTEGMGC